MNRSFVLTILLVSTSGCAVLTSHPNYKPSRYSRHFDSDSPYTENALENLNSDSKKEKKRELKRDQTIYSKSVEQLSTGMSKRSVMTLLGEPTDVQVAGNQRYENEKWVYRRYVPTEAGYQKDTKVIYFEHGKVAGWD